jgi:hypothetical protein
MVPDIHFEVQEQETCLTLQEHDDDDDDDDDKLGIELWDIYMAKIKMGI